MCHDSDSNSLKKHKGLARGAIDRDPVKEVVPRYLDEEEKPKFYHKDKNYSSCAPFRQKNVCDGTHYEVTQRHGEHIEDDE